MRFHARLSTMTRPVAALLLTAAPLTAQIPERPGPPPPANSIWPYVIAFILLGAVLTVAMKSSNRGHQD